MPKRTKTFLYEMLWPALAFGATLLTINALFLRSPGSGTLDLHLHDTFFVFAAWYVIVPLFLLFYFLILFVREASGKFSRTVPNIILVASGLLLMILSVYLIKEIVRTASMRGGWVAYAPLTSMEQVEPPSADPLMDSITNALIVLQMVLTIALLVVVYFWGRNRGRTSGEAADS